MGVINATSVVEQYAIIKIINNTDSPLLTIQKIHKYIYCAKVTYRRDNINIIN